QETLGTKTGRSCEDVRPDEEDARQNVRQQTYEEGAESSRNGRDVHRSIDHEAANNRGRSGSAWAPRIAVRVTSYPLYMFPTKAATKPPGGFQCLLHVCTSA